MKRQVLASVALLSLAGLAACGAGAVRATRFRIAEPRALDAPVRVFVRPERMPPCPFEQVGHVSAAPGWQGDPKLLAEVEKKVRGLGGDGVLLEDASSAGGVVVRLSDPGCK